MEKIRKKIGYIWDYYKVHIFVGIVVIYIIVSSIIAFRSPDEYDHSIAIISKENYPSQEKVDALKEIFEDKFDGTFDVKIYNIELGAYGQDEITISKLGLDIANTISEYMFIEDMDAFKKATNNIEFVEVALVNEIDWLSNLDLDNFYYFVRK